MARKNNPNSNPKSGGLGFVITALVLSSVTGFSLPGIVAGVLLGLGIGKVASIMGSGLDTTTHNKEDEERRRQEAEKAAQRQRQAAEEAARLKKEEEERQRREAASRIPLTGDPTADEVITKGQEMIRQIQEANDAIPDHLLSNQMNILVNRCDQIFRTVSQSPAKAPQVRKFMNYYLPTTLKILQNYHTMEERGVSYQEMQQARDTSVKGLNMILTACQQLIDNLHKENLMDISTDIEVLEQMLKRDGYVDGGLGSIRDTNASEPRTAMEAQMRSSSVPVMNFPVENNTDDWPTGSKVQRRE